MKDKDLSTLIYSRQFVMSQEKIKDFPFEGWLCTSAGNSFYIYTHPNLSVTQVRNGDTILTMLGYIIDPHSPGKSDEEILKSMLKASSSVKELLLAQDTLGGRYIIVMNNKQESILFNDACGLRQVYHYTDKENRLWCCSQPNSLSELIKLQKDDYIIDNFVKKIFVKENENYYWPGYISEYIGLKKLPPNHFLNLKNKEVIRFYPYKPIVEISLEEGISKASELFKKIMDSINRRFSIALSLTAGLDTRTLLSACRNMKESVFYYTLLYPPNYSNSPDLAVPRKIAFDLGFKHNVLDCRKQMSREFRDVYRKNVSYAHRYWGDIAYGMYKNFPRNMVGIKGNGDLIARCVMLRADLKACKFYDEGKTNARTDLINFLADFFWKKNPVAMEILENWFENSKENESKYNFHNLDMFQWEHAMPNWQAVGQLEWDIAQECFLPYNNRSLLFILLSVNYRYRIEPDYVLFKEIIRSLWPELLDYPFNPSTPKDHVYITFQKYLKKKLGKYGPA